MVNLETGTNGWKLWAMVTRKVKVKNKAGIHCRPSSAILLKAAEFPNCRLLVTGANGESDLSSILSLISLGLEWGAEATVQAEGKNEKLACDTIADLLEYEFDFPPR